jgi:ABC-type lipoprotein release transport system permease subunit
MLFKIAWRNIWRNPRRTLVIITAVIIGVWTMLVSSALMRGIADGMVKNGIKTLTGHIQIHRTGYRNDPVIENSITDLEAVKSALDKHLASDDLWTLRVKVNAIASNARHSGAVMMVGIDPLKEAKISFIGNSVTKGSYFSSGDDEGIIIGKTLADNFETRIGHKIILMSQDKEKEIASSSFEITGIFEAELKATEEFFIFITRNAAQDMLNIKSSISEAAIVLKDEKSLATILSGLKTSLSSDEYEISSWKELLPLVAAYLKVYDEFMIIWYLVIFTAMSFGIVNTTLMAVFERIREFGLLKSLGMRPRFIVKQVLTESFFLLLIGALTGNLLSFIVVYVFSKHGIDLTSFSAGTEFAGMTRIIYPIIIGKDIFLANFVVFMMGLLVCLYPAVKAARITPVKALAYT